MNEQERAAMQQALEALRLNNDEWKALADSGDCGHWTAESQDHYKQTNAAIVALEAALAQQPEPVQEPVESALQAVAEKIGDQCAVWYGIGARDVEEVLREAARHGLVHGALAGPVQEPVAWRVRRNDGQYELYFVKASAERAAECYIKRPQVEPLYTAPPQRPAEPAQEQATGSWHDGLLEGQLRERERWLAQDQAETEPACKCSLRGRLVGDGCEVCNPKLAAELRQQPEPVQEPVAWRFQSAVGGWAYGSQPPLGSKYPAYPLYAAPPQRKPLTDEEIAVIEESCMGPVQYGGHENMTQERVFDVLAFARAVERKVRG